MGSSMVAPRTRQMCPTTRQTLWSMQTRRFFRGCACPRSQTLRFCTRESFPGGHPFTSTESHSPTSPLAGVLPGIGPPFCTCELSAGTGSSQVQKRYSGRRKTPARWGGALRGSARVNGCPAAARARSRHARRHELPAGPRQRSGNRPCFKGYQRAQRPCRCSTFGPTPSLRVHAATMAKAHGGNASLSTALQPFANATNRRFMNCGARFLATTPSRRYAILR